MLDDRGLQVATTKDYNLKGFTRARDALYKELEIVEDGFTRHVFFGWYNDRLGWHLIDPSVGNEKGDLFVWYMGVSFDVALAWLKAWVGEFE